MQMVLMKKGVTDNGFEITEEMILNSLDSFKNKPIVLNQNQFLKDYTDNNNVTKFNDENCIGVINSAEYIDDKVIGDVVYFRDDFGQEEFDNWQIELSEDKKSFNYCSCEVF